MTTENYTTISARPHSIPPIYLSYSNQSDFLERYFVVKLYDQLVKNGLGEGVIWFDHHQDIHPDRSATWFADRLEAIDFSHGSLLILSNTCECQRLMLIELKTIVDRKMFSTPYGLFVILLDQCQSFSYLHTHADFFHAFKKFDSIFNIDEYISVILHELLEKLLPYQQMVSIKNKLIINEEQFKPLCSWSSRDIQSFLTRLGVHQSSRELFLKNHIDGYLLLACTENELKHDFLMNNSKIRQELMENVIQTIRHERHSSTQWHYAARKIKAKSAYIYLIFHPEDSSIASRISSVLQDKNFRIFTRNPDYGKTKDAFLAVNGPLIARTKYVIYILTNKSSSSIFSFLELTTAEWFEKSIVTVYVENTSTIMRPSIRALLANHPSVDFIHQSFNESLTMLCTYLRPSTTSLQESTEDIRKSTKTLQSLPKITTSNSHLKSMVYPSVNEKNSRCVYISYSNINDKWNVAHALERLIFVLEKHYFHTGMQMKSNNHYLPKIQLKSASMTTSHSYLQRFNQSITTSTDMRRVIDSRDIRHCCAMIVCLTPKYFQSEHCLNELRLCELYQKPMIVCLLRYMNCYSSNTNVTLDEQINMLIPSRLPVTTLCFLRKSIRSSCLDLTTDDLFSRNITILLRKLETLVGRYPHQIKATTGSLNSNSFSQTTEIF